MRPFALVLRAGAAVIAVAFVVSLLVDGTPAPVALKAKAATKPESAKGTTIVVKTTTRPNTPAGVVTIAATGDIVMGSTPNLPSDGGRSFFDNVETDLAGDVVGLATVVVVALTVSGFDAAFAFSATGAGVPSMSREKTNATATSTAPARRTSANRRTGAR